MEGIPLQTFNTDMTLFVNVYCWHSDDDHSRSKRTHHIQQHVLLCTNNNRSFFFVLNNLCFDSSSQMLISIPTLFLCLGSCIDTLISFPFLLGIVAIRILLIQFLLERRGSSGNERTRMESMLEYSSSSPKLLVPLLFSSILYCYYYYYSCVGTVSYTHLTLPTKA